MNALAQSRHVDKALTNAFARRVFAGDTYVGRIHRGEHNWIAESADGRLIGRYQTEKCAVNAILNAARRA